jgi:hypothetical protein
MGIVVMVTVFCIESRLKLQSLNLKLCVTFQNKVSWELVQEVKMSDGTKRTCMLDHRN